MPEMSDKSQNDPRKSLRKSSRQVMTRRPEAPPHASRRPRPKALERNLARTERLTHEQIHEFQQAFDLFDGDSSGTITSSELITVMQSLNMKPRESEINYIVNVSGSKQISSHMVAIGGPKKVGTYLY